MNRSRTTILALVVNVAAAVGAQAQAQKVDEYIKAEMQRQHVAGVSVAVVKDGKVIKAQGYGLANVELNVPAAPETVYKIGSVSKQFLATGIMLLIQDGKLKLDDKINQFLEGAPDTWQEITIRHLLTHTSGILREGPAFDPFKVQSDADVIKSAYSEKLRFAPGEKYEYCNVGYFTLAEIIRKVSGKPWGEFLKERVFTPLEMNATRTTTMTDIVRNRADGYLWRASTFENAREYLALRPSGAFLSTVLDLAKWDAALYGDRILQEATRNQMWSPLKFNNGSTHPYGFGWELQTIAGHRVVHHGGSLPGFRAQFMRFVDDKLTVVVLTNADNVSPEPIAIGVASHYIPGLIPERTAIKLPTAVLDRYVGQYQAPSAPLFTVTREGEKLVLQQGSGDQRVELQPESEVSFFNNDNRRLTYLFEKDDGGQVSHLVVKREGRELGRAKKTK